MAINWKFIGTLEGAEVLNGYVPDPEKSQSGVTIATGVDLGQLSAAQLNSWAIDEALKAKLAPYCGRRSTAAVDYLSTHPLTITQAECEQIDAVAEADCASQVAAAYNASAHMSFADLPDRAQTVIASVAYQYGNLKVRCPRFWAAAVVQNWASVVAELENFGDSYRSRRLKEAAYLRPILTPATATA